MRFDSMRSELRNAARGIRRQPIFTAAVVATLGIGIGGSVATFSVADRLLFRAPPGIAKPAQLRRLYARQRVGNGKPFVTENFSVPEFSDFAASVQGAATVVAYTTGAASPLGDDGVSVSVSYVSPEFFRALGVHPDRGRFFDRDENLLGAPRAVAVVSFALWKRALGGDPTIIGSDIILSGAPTTVVGVAEQHFHGVDLDAIDVWLPLASDTQPAGTAGWTNRDARFLSLIARLGDRHANRRLADRLTTQYHIGHAADAAFDPAARIIAAPLLAARGPLPLLPNEQANLLLTKRLVGISLAVLLVVVANVIGLLLLRTVRRRHEITVRLALGMSRGRLAGQLCAETGVLASLALIAGVVVGWWGSTTLQRGLLPDIQSNVSLTDHRSILVAAALALAVSLSAGLAPLYFALRTRSTDSLRTSARAAEPMGTRFRRVLVVAQTAGSVVLIGFSAAFLASLYRVDASDLGFDRERLITVARGGIVSPENVSRLMAKLRTLPFVESVSNATADVRPGRQMTRFSLRDADSTRGKALVSFNLVDSTYFATVGLDPLRGRALSAQDRRGSEPVMVISASLADAYWGRRDPVGDCAFTFRNRGICRRVVGVVADVRWDLTAPAIPNFYLPLEQAGPAAGRYVLVRTGSQATERDAREIERAAAATDPVGIPSRVSREAMKLEPQLRPLRASATIFMVFGVLVLFCAASGIYAGLTYDISRRSHELGVRMALGATRRDLVRIVMQSGTRDLAIGIGAGVGATVLSAPLVTQFLFDSHAYDPLVLVASTCIIVLAAMIAMLLPARRVARLDPVTLLRAD